VDGGHRHRRIAVTRLRAAPQGRDAGAGERIPEPLPQLVHHVPPRQGKEHPAAPGHRL